MLSQPWAVTWRKALVSAPRLVPDAVLRFTSPEGPQPIVFAIPSRGKHLIPLYVFIPPSTTPTEIGAVPSNLPILVDFHGGGFVLGSCQEQAPFCAKACRELNCVAISVDYRLGPYAQFPAALEDAEDVLGAMLNPSEPGYVVLRGRINGYLTSKSRPPINLDATRIALSGFSSGGNLALNLVTNIGPPQFPVPWPCPIPRNFPNDIPVLMYYAAIDLRKLPSEREIIAGFHEAPKTLIASLQLEQNLMPTYLPRGQIEHLRASPALADVKDGLHKRAKCLLLLAEKDSLSTQNEVWAKKAVDAGRDKDVSILKFLGVVHGWCQFPTSWLDGTARTKKYEAHNKAVEFVRDHWRAA